MEIKKIVSPFQKVINATSSLMAALAEKGSPGIILLCIILIAIWALPVYLTMNFFDFLPNISQNTDPWFNRGYLFISFIILILATLAYGVTKSVIGLIVPTIKAEAEAATLMSHAFGGRVLTATGRLRVEALPIETAKRRIHKIMDTLVRRAANLLEVVKTNNVRANIFVTQDELWLSIANGFHLNMEGETQNDRELTIKILKGYLSSGTAYKYFRPVLSIAHEDEQGKIVWDHTPDPAILREQGIHEDVLQKLEQELNKAHRDLRWIVSMPIPYQVRPFKMACGVLNLDGLLETPYRDQLKSLLADASVAASLIGVINRTTYILSGQCHSPDKVPKNVGGVKQERLVKKFMISPEEFDPADCPEPTDEFKDALSKVKGLEFFKRISTTDVAEFLREQLRS